jgi:hypothetical protein
MLIGLTELSRIFSFRNVRVCLFLILFGMKCNGCGYGQTSSDCSKSVLFGNWKESSSGLTVNFGSDCSIYTSNCKMSGTVPALSSSSGTFNITGLQMGDTSCAKPTNNTCQYALSGGSLTMTCVGGAQHIFTKS